MTKWVEVTCKQCGKTLEKLIVNVKGNKNSFCNNVCSQKYIAQSRAKFLNCKRCGKPLRMGEGYYGTSKKNRTYICDLCAIDIEKEKIKSKILKILNKYVKYKNRQEVIKKSTKYCLECGRELPITRRLKNIKLCGKCVKKNSRKKNPKYIVNQRMKTAIRKALAGNKAGRKWEDLVGYTVKDLMMRLEGLFSEGMTWENMGEWHVDHIIPKSSFDYKDTGDASFKEAWALDNLQPLWAADNMSKGVSMPGDKEFIRVGK